jgi:hypothetical protein
MTISRLFTVPIFLFFTVSTASADEYFDFMRISCIPEANYFRVDYTKVEVSSVLLERENDIDRSRQEERLQVWHKQGYYDAAGLSYECKLQKSTYKILTVQPTPRATGQCGAAPQITFNLFRNSKPILDKVVFGEDCFGGPSVVGLEISDGYDDELHFPNMTLYFSPNSISQPSYKYFDDAYGDISKAIPIDQKKILEYVGNKSK